MYTRDEIHAEAEAFAQKNFGISAEDAFGRMQRGDCGHSSVENKLREYASLCGVPRGKGAVGYYNPRSRMPLVERTPGVCFSRFVEHINQLAMATLPTHTPFVLLGVEQGVARCGFVQPVTLHTSLGALEFELSQQLDTVPDDRGFRLRTLEYAYRLVRPNAGDALFRWEFLREPKDSPAWCRHHFHVHASVGDHDIGGFHLPTGPVLIEYVIRFLLNDLGVKKPDADWEELLAASEAKFHAEFRPLNSAWALVEREPTAPRV